MTRSEIGVFVVWIVTIGTLTLLVFGALPSLARTIFRSRLDSLRDQCMDAVLAGQLAMSQPVEQFLAALDMQNRVARQLTLLRVSLIVAALRRINTDFTAPRWVSFGELDPTERKILHELARKMNRALARYLVWGSPLGWVIAPFALLASGQEKDRRSHNPVKVDRTAADFTRAGAFNELPVERLRRLQRVA